MENLKVETKNSVMTLWLNRPQVRNAFDDEMISEMTAQFQQVAKQDSLRALVIRGEGESFCAGGDLNWMKSMVHFSENENLKDSEKLFEMYEALTQVPVPVICHVHGHCMGGGLGLMAASDIVLSEMGTKFCFSEVRIGLAPAVISSFVAKKVHASQMSRYFLTAEVFGPEEAHQMGLVHEFGSSDEVQVQLEKIIKKVTQNSPQAVRATKALIQSLESDQDIKKMTTECIAQLRVSSEGQEGLKSFLEKRKPQWLGSDQ